jgi:hypothetical protein
VVQTMNSVKEEGMKRKKLKQKANISASTPLFVIKCYTIWN